MRLELAQKYERKLAKKRRDKLFNYIGLLCFALGIFIHPYFFIIPVLYVIKATFRKRHTVNDSILYRGYRGEKETVKLLNKLPSDFSNYQYIEFNVKNKNINLDHIVIGPTGLFLIKSTSRGGVLYGHIDDNKWEIHQSERIKMNNPIRTVKWQTHQLSTYLKSKGFHQYIQPMVFLSDPGSVYQFLETEDFPIFNNRMKTPDNFTPYIKNYNKGRGLSQKELKELKDLFSKIGVKN